ncbi:hypothetical protein Taro_028834 [Colocasia esculenta]|uniref:Retrotransposon gag domain-containing protein n=1 Tax=Colocasia esculenta TaxID=4460 RepID=A0A843VJM7_COLES|nr:hypothetical protein [Colocasia esculenta]
MCATWRALKALSSGRRQGLASRSGGDASLRRVSNRCRFLKNPSRQNPDTFCSAGGGAVEVFSGDFGSRARYSARFRCKELVWSIRIAGEASYRMFFVQASARSREADSDQVRYRFNGLGRGVPSQLVSEQEISGMVDRRDWGGGGDDPEESTQRMIERIWESLTDIRARMDQQAPVPPVAVPPGDGETVPIAPVLPRVEVPFVAPVPPPPPVLIAEEPVMQVEKFLRLQPPTYSRGPNPDTAEHWVHEIESVFATMRCPTADRVVLAAYQLRGFALEWWRLKMQTTFAGRTEEAITWSEILDVFNDTFFPIQVQQVKREQFRTLQQGEFFPFRGDNRGKT